MKIKACVHDTKKHDSALLHRVSNECEHDSLYVSKVQPGNKIHAASCKRSASQSSN